MVFPAATPTGTPRLHDARARRSLPPLPPPRKAKQEDADAAAAGPNVPRVPLPLPPRETGTNNKRLREVGYPPPKRSRVSATRTLPPGYGRPAAAARPDGASASASAALRLRKPPAAPPPPPPPLSLRKPASGSGASAALVARPIAGRGSSHHAPDAARVLRMTPSGAGGPPRPIAQSWRGGKDLVPATRSLPKPTMVSATRRFPAVCGRVTGTASQSLKFPRAQSNRPSAGGASFALKKKVIVNALKKNVIVKDPDRASQSLMSADVRATTESSTSRGSFSLKKKVTVKDPALLRLKVASACTMGSISKPVDVVDIILEDDGFLKALDAYDRELQSNLSAPSHVPSVRHQSQNGAWNADSRSKVRMTCERFRFVCKAAVRYVEQHSLKVSRIDIVAANVMKALPGPGHTQHRAIVGNIPGVEIGDEFLYRVELALVGLHRPRQAGIDTTRDGNNVLIATSIVASGGYPDRLSRSGELIYIGSGGKLAGKKNDEDQELKRGNLALMNCIETKTPVRVIHGLKGGHSRAKGASAFSYDGLYHVLDCWSEGQQGSKVYKYHLQRIPGQQEVPATTAKLPTENCDRVLKTLATEFTPYQTLLTPYCFAGRPENIYLFSSSCPVHPTRKLMFFGSESC